MVGKISVSGRWSRGKLFCYAPPPRQGAPFDPASFMGVAQGGRGHSQAWRKRGLSEVPLLQVSVARLLWLTARFSRPLGLPLCWGGRIRASEAGLTGSCRPQFTQRFCGVFGGWAGCLGPRPADHTLEAPSLFLCSLAAGAKI